MSRMMRRRWARGAASVAAAPTMGFLAARDEGTVADYYVSPSGNDANAGTSVAAPKLTIGSARAAAVAAGGARHIKVRAGTYRETVDLSASPNITLSRYGTEVATVSGQDLIPAGAWSLADASDDAWLGAALRAQGVVWKATVPTASIASGDPRAAFPHEGATPLVPAQARLANPAFPLSAMCEAQWLNSAVAGTNPLSTYVLPASQQGQGWTAAQVLNADVLFHEGANFNKRRPIAAYDAASFTVTPSYGGSFSRSGEVAKRDRFALINLLPALAQGGWGYRVSGSDTVLYVWPASPASITNGAIGYTRRTKGIALGNGCRVRGLRTFGHAAAGADLTSTSGSGIWAQGRSNVQVENCLVESVWNPESGWGAVLIETCDDAVVANCSVAGAYGTFGFNVMGNFSGDWNTAMTAAQLGQRNKLKACTAQAVEMSPIRWHSQSQGVVLGFKALWPCGTQAHANQVEAYIQCSRNAFVGLDFAGCYGGYATIQSSSEMAFLACNMPVAPGSYGRGFADQSSLTLKDPAALGVGTTARYMLSCRVPPHPTELGGGPLAGAALGVGNGAGGVWTARANILHGVSAADDNGGTGGTGHVVNDNVLTAGAAPAGSTGNTAPGQAAVYAEAALGDFTYLPGAAFRSAARQNLSAEVAVIKGWFANTGPGGTAGRLFTDAEFDIDAAGQAVDWSAAPYGPLASYDGHLGRAASWGSAPAIPSSYSAGNALAPAFWLDASPFPAVSYLWEKSTDGIAWTSVATTRSYTPTENPSTTQLRVTVAPAGLAARTSGVSGSLASSTDVGVPSLVHDNGGGTATLQGGVYKVEGAAFAPDPAKALFVAVFKRSTPVNTAVSAITRVSLGAAGRAPGGGTALTRVAGARSWGEDLGVYALGPGVAGGSQTLLVECSEDVNRLRILAYEVANASGLVGGTASAGNGGTAATVGPVATLHAGSRLLYAVQKEDGRVAQALSTAGAATLFNGQTSPAATQAADSQVFVGEEAAPTTGSYDASWSGGAVAVYVQAAVEIRKA